jgi:II/X family phage/plasmid replication protein
MIDTLKLKSPSIDEETALRIENHLIQRSGIEMSTGEELYNLCSGPLEGSWSSSMSVNVLRRDIKVFPALRAGQKVVTELVEVPPFITIEGSVHKAIMGHNVCGGPERIRPAIAWLVSDIERRLGCSLPPWQNWRVLRADIAEVYDLGSFEACAQFLHGLGLARFPRRQPQRYGDECVMFPGKTTTLKFYHKGPEFAKNGKDYARYCIQVMGETAGKNHIRDIQFMANNYLRVECSIKSRKLQQMNGGEPTGMHTDLQFLEGVHDRDTGRVLKEGQQDMETVRTTEEVRARLNEVHEERLANLLFGTWLQLAAVGEEGVRRGMSRRSYYRHRSLLADSGIAWNATDVYIREQSFIPAGFRPVRSDPRRLTGESLEVRSALLPFAAAV